MGNTFFRMKERGIQRLASRRAASSAGLVMGVLLGHILEEAILLDSPHGDCSTGSLLYTCRLPTLHYGMALEYKAECNPILVWK